MCSLVMSLFSRDYMKNGSRLIKVRISNVLTYSQVYSTPNFYMVQHQYLFLIALYSSHDSEHVLLRNLKIIDHNLQRMEVFLKKWHISFIGLYRPTSAKVFTCTCRIILRV